MNVSAKNVIVWIWSKFLMIRNISISCITWCFFRIPFDPTSREILFDWWAGAWERVDWILVVARSVHKHMLCLLLYFVQVFETVVTFFLIACTLKIKPLAVYDKAREVEPRPSRTGEPRLPSWTRARTAVCRRPSGMRHNRTCHDLWEYCWECCKRYLSFRHI